MIIITATFAQALSASGGVVSIVVALTVWRFIVSIFISMYHPCLK